MASTEPFVPALIVVDMQEDFCPPNGTLAVPHGRTLSTPINTLLSFPFPLRIATKDWHPENHISFAANHPAPHNQPFTSTHTIRHPTDPSSGQTDEIRLWPQHCVQDTPGAELIPELHTSRLTHTFTKGLSPDVEQYSIFGDPFGVSDASEIEILKEKGVTDVFVVGLTADYCVRCTAVRSAEKGFRTWVVREGTRAVEGDRLEETFRGLEEMGVRVVGIEGEEVRRVRELK